MELTRDELRQIEVLKEEIEELTLNIENNKDILDDGLVKELIHDRDVLIDILHDNLYY